jgi:hypothetical protein
MVTALRGLLPVLIEPSAATADALNVRRNFSALGSPEFDLRKLYTNFGHRLGQRVAVSSQLRIPSQTLSQFYSFHNCHPLQANGPFSRVLDWNCRCAAPGIEPNVKLNRVIKQSHTGPVTRASRSKVFHCNTPRQALSCVSVDQFL